MPRDSALTLMEVLALARSNNPRLRAALHQVQASTVIEPEAGALPDPMFEVGVMNLALPEFSADMPASMAPSFQLTQHFPLAGKLGLKQTLAGQATQVLQAGSEETWWRVRREASGAFFTLYQVDRQLEVLSETLELLREFETVARALYAAGSGRQADVLRATVEVARMDAEIQRMQAMRTARAASLNALLGRPADTPVPTPSLPALPLGVPELQTLTRWAQETRPRLRAMRLGVEQAATKEELAKRSIWPDITVGIQYGLGRMAGDYKSMGGAMVGFGLPVHAGKRQYAARDEALALRLSAEAGLEDARAEIGAEILMELAELGRSRSLLSLYREDILPQARATVESALNAYRAGTVDFMTLVDAQMAVNRFRGEYFALVSSYGTSLAALETTIGRELPVADPLILEDR
ncbi:MAG: TolC family protein [Longimicrobiales bacterium]